MRALRLAAISRGIDLRWIAILLISMGAAIAAASLAFQMKTAADQNVPGRTLDSTVLIGAVLPATVLGRTLRNASAWLVVTSSRNRAAQRATWICVLYALAILTAWGIAYPLTESQSPDVVAWSTLILIETALVSTILLSAELAWVLPGLLALACSTPGLIPLNYNWLVTVDRASELHVVAVVLGLVTAAAYIWLDEHGIRRSARLVERQPGVLSD